MAQTGLRVELVKTMNDGSNQPTDPAKWWRYSTDSMFDSWFWPIVPTLCITAASIFGRELFFVPDT